MSKLSEEEKQATSDTVVTGSCLCGDVKYQVKGPFSHFRYCHCSRCRKATGSAHAANLFAKVSNITWLTAEDKREVFMLEEAQGFGKHFCKRCGSALPFDFGNLGKILLIPAGTLDDDPKVTPRDNIFWADKAPWFEHCSNMPCHDEFDH